jgi:hypothetical protein
LGDIAKNRSLTPVCGCADVKNGLETTAPVEKRLHIHSGECAKADFFPGHALLSKKSSAWIQCFSSAFGSM